MKVKDKKTLIIVAIIVVLLVIIAIWIAKKLSNSGGSTGREEENPTDTPTGTDETATFPLVYGSRGKEVKQLQTFLNELVGTTDGTGFLVVDGIIGNKTKTKIENANVTSYAGVPLKLPLQKETFIHFGINQF